MSSRIREDLILKRENLRVELRPEWSDFWFKGAIRSPHRVCFRPENTDFRPERFNFGPQRGNFESWADFRPTRANFGPEKADMRLKRADLGPERSLGRRGGRTDVCTDRLTSGNSPLCPTGRRPFGAAAQKGEWMDHRINGETN